MCPFLTVAGQNDQNRWQEQNDTGELKRIPVPVPALSSSDI